MSRILGTAGIYRQDYLVLAHFILASIITIIIVIIAIPHCSLECAALLNLYNDVILPLKLETCEDFFSKLNVLRAVVNAEGINKS